MSGAEWALVFAFVWLFALTLGFVCVCADVRSHSRRLDRTLDLIRKIVEAM